MLDELEHALVINFVLLTVETLVRQYHLLRKQHIPEEKALQTIGDEYIKALKVVRRQQQIIAQQVDEVLFSMCKYKKLYVKL